MHKLLSSLFSSSENKPASLIRKLTVKRENSLPDYQWHPAKSLILRGY